MSYRLILRLLVTPLLNGCFENSQSWSKFPVFPNANDVQEFNLLEDRAHQVSYVVTAVYPNTGVAEFYSGEVREPWVPCFEMIKWQSFADATRDPAAYIHQVRLYWVNYETNRLLLLGIRYISEGSKFKELPDNPNQNIYLVEYQEANVDQMIATLELTCVRT